MEAEGDSCQLLAVPLVLHMLWTLCRQIKRRGTVRGGQGDVWLLRCLMFLKGAELLCISTDPRLPPPAASLVRAFLVINSAFPEQGGWSLNLLYPWGEAEHQSPLPSAAAGA